MPPNLAPHRKNTITSNSTATNEKKVMAGQSSTTSSFSLNPIEYRHRRYADNEAEEEADDCVAYAAHAEPLAR